MRIVATRACEPPKTEVNQNTLYFGRTALGAHVEGRCQLERMPEIRQWLTYGSLGFKACRDTYKALPFRNSQLRYADLLIQSQQMIRFFNRQYNHWWKGLRCHERPHRKNSTGSG